MAEFSVNRSRYDPYKNFKFLVRMDGRVVLGISKITGWKRTTEVIKHRHGGMNSMIRRTPGRSEYDALTLERGVTHDMDFDRWASKVWDRRAEPGKESSLKDFRKNIIVEVLNEAGQVALSLHVFDCWVSEYQPLSDLDATGGSNILIARLKLENHGWSFDPAQREPTEPLLSP